MTIWDPLDPFEDALLSSLTTNPTIICPCGSSCPAHQPFQQQQQPTKQVSNAPHVKVDLIDGEEAVWIWMDLPGVHKEDLHITVDKERQHLHVEAERPHPMELLKRQGATTKEAGATKEAEGKPAEEAKSEKGAEMHTESKGPEVKVRGRERYRQTIKERHHGRLHRTVPLPAHVNLDEFRYSKYEEGVLELCFGRQPAEVSGIRTLKIQ